MKEVLTEKKAKRALMRYFSCAETMLTLLNRAQDLEMEEVEQASDPLNGGILLELDAACGILWGAGLAAGIRAQRKFSDEASAIDAALYATQQVLKRLNQEGFAVNCTDIIGMNKWNMIIYMLKGNISRCESNLARRAPQFDQILDSALDEYHQKPSTQRHTNCACETMMRVSQAIGLDVRDHTVIPAGFAGGLGLSGNACGALATAIFAQCLKYFISRDKPRHSMMRSMLQGFRIGDAWMNPSRNLAKEFKDKFGTKSCKDISKTEFSSISDLGDFLDKGGCREVVDTLVELAQKHQSV